VETRLDLTKINQRLRKQNNLRIICPNCGNDSDFFEVADGAILTTRYIQNPDGSFSQEGDESQILGEIHFFCAECNEDLSLHHQRFVEMLF
jgi:ssDNA-binding Zn-finger/Zn-ribbon topoisomerase 1